MMKLTEEERKYFPGTDAYHYSESCREAAVKHNQNPMSMSMTIEYVIKYMPELIIDTPLFNSRNVYQDISGIAKECRCTVRAIRSTCDTIRKRLQEGYGINL